MVASVWIPACAFLLPLAVVTFLFENEQRETQIDFDAKVSAFSATLRDKQPLFRGSLLGALNAAGLDGVDNLSAGDGDCSVDVKLGARPRPEDAINLQLLEVPQGWRVRLEHVDNSIEVGLSDPAAKPGSAHEEVLTTVSLGGRATVETGAAGAETCASSKPRIFPRSIFGWARGPP